MGTEATAPDNAEIRELRELLAAQKAVNEELTKRHTALEERDKATADKSVRRGFYSEADDDDQDSAPAMGRHKAAFQRIVENKAFTDRDREIQKWNDELFLTSQILGKDPRELRRYKEFSGSSAISDLRKALDSATSGEGAEWIPTTVSNEMWENIRLESKVTPLFREIVMPTNPFTLPVVTSLPTVYLVPQSKDDESAKAPASTPGSGNSTLTAKKLKARVLWSEELTEDGVASALPLVTQNIVEAIARAEDEAIISGDTAAVHQDSDVTSSLDRRKSFDGLRKRGLAAAATKVDMGTFNLAAMRALRKKLGAYGLNPGRLAWLVGPNVWNLIVAFSEVTTVQNFGAAATIVNGVLMKIDGIDIIPSDVFREDLNASGVYDGSTTDNADLLLVYKPAFVVGRRKKVTVKMKADDDTDQTIMNVYTRLDFMTPLASTQYVVGAGYNITV